MPYSTMTPLCSRAAVPESDAWESGSFPAIAAAISPAFGKVILVASTASGVSQCIASVACYSRQLQVRLARDAVGPVYPETSMHALFPTCASRRLRCLASFLCPASSAATLVRRRRLSSPYLCSCVSPCH